MADELQTVLLVAGRFQLRGTSAYTLRLARLLPNYGFQPIIITPDASTVSRESREGMQIQEHPWLDSPILSRIAAHFAARDAQKQHPVLMHIQSRYAMANGQAINRRLRLPCLVTVHDYLNENEGFPFDTRFGRRIIAVSESVREGLLRHRAAPNEMLTTISSGVEIPSEADNSSVLSVRRVPVIGTAGALESDKGLNYFLEAARKVLDAGHDAEFLIAGTGPEETALRRKAGELKLVDHVTFIPNLPEFDAALHAIDIFCLPSLRQGLGTIMLEAMSLGRPVIATSVGGAAAIVEDGRTGLIVPPASSERLAQRMIELLNDPLRARAIGIAARNRVMESFDVDQMVQRTAAEYRRVLETAQPANARPSS